MITENDLESKNKAEEMIFPRMAMVHNFLEIWQGPHDLHATQRESRPKN